MSQVNILVTVNVEQAIATGELGEYVFMIDSNDSSNTDNKTEGTNELKTYVTNGDTIVWQVVPINPNSKVQILNFNSKNAYPHEEAIPNVINPSPYPDCKGSVWGGKVLKTANNAQYTVTLLLQGNKIMTFDPFITSKNTQ